jgi:hypothetical protein
MQIWFISKSLVAMEINIYIYIYKKSSSYDIAAILLTLVLNTNQSINLTSGNQSAGGLQSLDVLEQYSNF